MIEGCDTKIDALKKLYFDGGTDTYIFEAADDSLQFIVGTQVALELKENSTTSAGDDGNMAYFKDAAAGFTQVVATGSTSDGDEINIDFRQSNKQRVVLAEDTGHWYFRFPDMSGNFQVVVIQDSTGGWNNAGAWRTKDSAGNAGAGNSGVVAWAAGTAPPLTETANKADILSFYWDADNEIAYGTYSSNF